LNNRHWNVHLQRSCNKYGYENFKFYILEICDRNLLDELETYYIKLYNTKDKELGFNLTDGGKGVRGVSEETRAKMALQKIGKTGAKRSLETCKRISDALMGKKASPETIEKNRLSSLGNTYMLGKTHTKETKDGLSMFFVGKKININSTSKYVGVCFDKSSGFWKMTIGLCGERFTGNFKTEVEAALAYNDILLEYYGWKAKDKLNVIPQEEIDDSWKI
jgi:group I intron endonuclease